MVSWTLPLCYYLQIEYNWRGRGAIRSLAEEGAMEAVWGGVADFLGVKATLEGL